MAKLSSQTVDAIKQTVDAACADRQTGIPGTTVVVVDREGKELFAHAAGTRGFVSKEPMTLDSIYWIASCTKMLVGIACMQLVEKGVLELDDVQGLEVLCPELRAVKVLEGDIDNGFKLVEKKRGITLRMLLNHTAGFGYTFFNEKLRDYGLPIGIDEFTGDMRDFVQPLVNQPGERWEYGTNIDWAGVALERATKMSLNDYMVQNIFEPLGLKNINMIPTKDMKEKLVYMNVRNPDGTLTFRDAHIMSRSLRIEKPEEIASYFNSGGAGCFAKPQEYCQILATLLNDGTSPSTGVKILQPSTINEMFTNQIPEFPNFGRVLIPAARAEYTNPIPELYPVPGNPPQGWGLTMMLSNGGATGRSKSTGFWAGLPNLWWWCDRENGVAGMVAAQIVPFGDPNVLNMWAKVESMVYEALKA
ncbi:beta-lactamase [Rhizodiscina lignyota]|uniref:Beta-lactamase n=1 Tax=Rhizodiscina lignyota TaxID=1504668 RepID=A0A9P4I7B6_9PEZI|nr:beta-lactamase [Rhizodiscina lignyota]